MAPAADLHVHTTRSDGSLALADVPAAARRAGLDAVAVTDHDRVHPGLDAPVIRRGGVTLIRGIELRADAGERVDLLGYGVRPTPALRSELDRLQRDRIERGAAIIDCVEDRLGIDLDLESREGIGRPHIARAVAAHPDAPYDVTGAFEHLIGDGRPCYVARSIPAFERARDLDAIERWYPYEREADPAPVERAMAEWGLLPTGGSDAHGDDLGRAGTPRSAYRRIADRLPDPA